MWSQVQRILRNIETYSAKVTSGLGEMGTIARIQVLRNSIMKLKDTFYRNAKTRRQEIRKTAGYADFQVSITCLARIAPVTNALIRFLAESRGVMCIDSNYQPLSVNDHKANNVGW